jgi:hypothetical protein
MRPPHNRQHAHAPCIQAAGRCVGAGPAWVRPMC